MHGLSTVVDDRGGGGRLGRLGLSVQAAAPGAIFQWNTQPAWRLERTLGKTGADSPFIDRINSVRFDAEGRLLATGGGEPSRSGEIKMTLVPRRRMGADLEGWAIEKERDYFREVFGRELSTAVS